MGNCESCGGCSGSCHTCPGCARELVLTDPEIAFLNRLGQCAFLPVARKTEDSTPIFPEGSAETSLLLQCLEKKGLISLDYDKPLRGFHDPVYDAFPIRGSVALTKRGQDVLELMEYQGVQP